MALSSSTGIIHESLRQMKMFHFSLWICFSTKIGDSGGGSNYFSVVEYLPTRKTYNQISIILDMSYCPYTEKAERSGLPISLPSGGSALWSLTSGRQCLSPEWVKSRTGKYCMFPAVFSLTLANSELAQYTSAGEQKRWSNRLFDFCH